MDKAKPVDKKVNSSLISSYMYDSTNYVLTVTLYNGEDWEYKGVMPPVISQVFDSPGSIGAKWTRLIKHGAYQAKHLD